MTHLPVKRINSAQGQIQLNEMTQETDIMTGAQPSLLCLHRQVHSIQGEARKQFHRLRKAQECESVSACYAKVQNRHKS
jgi:hypothetical protein